ncbi:hypothetical protein ACN6K5_000897 [Streptomyces violaceoruber]|uniref:hypothetical protein n=1 Tax=Streptomyces violaceoruber TaxID=1935 RepID=UPI00403C6F55
MPHTSRKRSSRGSSRGANFKRSSLGKAEKTRNQDVFVVTFVYGAHDLTPRTKVTYDRRAALRIARNLADRGSRIVLVTKGWNTPSSTGKLIADLSTVSEATQ